MFVEADVLATSVSASAAAKDALRVDRQGGRQRAGRPDRIEDWDRLAEPLQLMLAGAALRRAAATVAFQAEMLAREMEAGTLEDCGGPEALRLLSAIVRVTGEPGIDGAGPVALP